ncbi:MAG: 50S ribosomal protein L29 [bacterium]|nr:50S ribosomal protein L29 [bacterium]
MKSNDQLKEFREMGEHELNEKYQELMKELFNLRFQGATIQLSSPARFKQVRREIARLKTVAAQRQITIG